MRPKLVEDDFFIQRPVLMRFTTENALDSETDDDESKYHTLRLHSVLVVSLRRCYQSSSAYLHLLLTVSSIRS